MNRAMTMLVGGVAFTVAVTVWCNNAEPPHVVTPRDPPVVKSAQDIAHDERIAREAYAEGGVKYLRQSMRNPDSFVLTLVGDMENGAICYEYRAQNGFGGMTGGQSVMIKNKVYDDPAKVRANCAGKARGEDITRYIN